MSERVVLVVDDEQTQRTVLAGFLRKRGFSDLEIGIEPEGQQTGARADAPTAQGP